MRAEKEKARKLAEEAAKLEAADAKAAELVRAGHAANDRGAPDTARAKFVAAYGHSKRPSTLVSAANMSFKMGDAQTAVREYEKVLHASGLTPNPNPNPNPSPNPIQVLHASGQTPNPYPLF